MSYSYSDFSKKISKLNKEIEGTKVSPTARDSSSRGGINSEKTKAVEKKKNIKSSKKTGGVKKPLPTKEVKQNNKRTLDVQTTKIRDKAIVENAVPRFMYGMSEGLANSTVGVPYSLLTGKKITDTKDERNQSIYDQIKDTKSFKAGNMAGEVTGYAIPFSTAGKGIDKATNAVLKTKVGQSLMSSLGTKGQQVLKGLTSSAIGDATIGTIQNAAISRGEGLTGKDFVKDFALNQALDFGVGGAMELAPAVVKGLKNKYSVPKEAKAIGNAVENIEKVVETPKIPNKASNITYNRGNVSQRLNTLEQTRKPVTGEFELPKKAEINKDKLKQPLKRKSVGADSINPEKTITELRQEYGTYGDNKTPLATDLGKVTKAAETIRKSPIMNENSRKQLNEGIKEGSYWTRTTKNSDILDKAKNDIDVSGLEKSTVGFIENAKSGKAYTSEDIIKGYELSQRHIKNGDYETADMILSEVAAMESEAGRNLQASRMFYSLSPEGRVNAVLRNVQKIGAKSKKEVKANPELLEQLKNATTEKEIAQINKKIAVDIWNQVPATFMEKLNAWRYLAMLGNPKTHIRNIIGNALYIPVRGLSDAVASGIEKAYGKKIAELGGNRTKAIVGYTGSDAQLRKKGKEVFKDVYDAISSGSSKYNDVYRDLDAKVFNSKILEASRKGNSKLLEGQDKYFMGFNFESAFAQYCKANGKKVSDLTDEFIKNATDYAELQALKATYRDTTKLSEMLSKIKRSVNEPGESDPLKKAVGLVVDSAVPFTKTPAAILARGIEHSPIGLARGMYNIATAKNAETLTKGIEYFAQGLTGTGLLALGSYMAQHGYVNGSMGNFADKEVKYKKMLGGQDYALTMPDGTSVTLSWIAPMNMPFFAGVEMGEMLKDKGLTGEGILTAMTSITEPVFEMSMLQGINNILDNAFSEGNPITNLVVNAAENYASQYIPTLSGQIARTLVESRKTSLSTKGSKLEKKIDQYFNKIPGLANLSPDYVDLWGRTDSKESASDYWKSAAENFLSPAYVEKDKTTSVDKELLRLGKKLDYEGKREILPISTKPESTVKYKDEEHSFTNEEYTQYLKDRGQESYKGLTMLFKTLDYQSMSADDKRKAIIKVYKKAKESADRSFLESKGIDKGEIAFEKDISEKAKERYTEDSGISKTRYVKYFTDIGDKADTNESGRLNKDELRAYAKKLGFTDTETAYLIKCYNKRW